MAFSMSFLLFATLLSFLPGLHNCNHVAKDSFREAGTFQTQLGLREYTAVSHLKMPVVPWADLAVDGIKIAECSKTSMTFVGKIDPEDFAVDVVIAIPKKLCASFGCPLPSPTEDDVIDRDDIIFRQIISAALRNGVITVKTRFISGAKVVPTVTLDIGQLVPSSDKQVSSDRQVENGSENFIDAVSRVDTVGFNNVQKSTSFNLTEGIKIDVDATFSGGVCEFVFDRFKSPPQVTFLQTLSADLLATLTVDANFRDRQSGLLFKEGIPDLGFSQDLELIGRVSIGIILALEYVTELDINADFSASFSASYVASSKVSLGGVNNAESMENSVGTSAAEINPQFQINSANFTVSGFVGLRPEVEAEVELPLIGEGGVRLAGTVALEAKVGYENPPFAPIAGETGACAACHEVGGSLDLVGRRLSVTALIPIANNQEFIIANEFFDIPIAQVCYYPISCPGTIEDERETCLSNSEGSPIQSFNTASDEEAAAQSQQVNEEQAAAQQASEEQQQAAAQQASEEQQQAAEQQTNELQEQVGAALAEQVASGAANNNRLSGVAGVSSEVNMLPADSSADDNEENDDEDSSSDSSNQSGSESETDSESSDSESESESESDEG